MATGEVARGDVLALPAVGATGVADAGCVPARRPAQLRARGAYLVYAGAAETAARLQPLDAAEVRPGGDALVRLHLERPLVLDVFEPVVLRDSGRDETVGGGVVLDPFPPGAVRGTAARVRRTEELEAREAAGRAGLPERVLAERAVVPWPTSPPGRRRPDQLPAALTAGRRARPAGRRPHGGGPVADAGLDPHGVGGGPGGGAGGGGAPAPRRPLRPRPPGQAAGDAQATAGGAPGGAQTRAASSDPAPARPRRGA